MKEAFSIQYTPDIVTTFIVAIRIQWPLLLVQNTFILLYSCRSDIVANAIRHSGQKVVA